MEMANFSHLNKVLVKRFNQGMLKVTLKMIPPISIVSLFNYYTHHSVKAEL